MHDETATISWNELYQRRRRIRKRYPSVWKLPRRRSPVEVLLSVLRPGTRLLDIGAGDKGLQAMLTERFPDLYYKSLDTDPACEADYRRLSEVNEIFDVVVMFEFIEHLPHAEGIGVLQSARELLGMGGTLVVSTPNVFHPSEYFRDATHVTPYCYDELGAALTHSGFVVRQLYRTYYAPFWERTIRRFAAGPVLRLLGMDYATKITAVAVKEEESP